MDTANTTIPDVVAQIVTTAEQIYVATTATCSAINQTSVFVKGAFVAIGGSWEILESLAKTVSSKFSNPEELKKYENAKEDLKKIKDTLTDLVSLHDSTKTPEELAKSIKEALDETKSLLQKHDTLWSKAVRNVTGHDNAKEELQNQQKELEKLLERLQKCLTLRKELDDSNKRPIESVLHPDLDDSGESIRKYRVLSNNKDVPYRLRYILRETVSTNPKYNDNIVSVENKEWAEKNETQQLIRKNDFIDLPLSIYTGLSRNHAVITAKKKLAEESLENDEDEYEFTLKNLNATNFTYYLDKEEQVTNRSGEVPVVMGNFQKLNEGEEVTLKNGDFIGLIVENSRIMNFGFQFLEN